MTKTVEYSLKRTTAPVIQPVLISEARDHLADDEAVTDEQLDRWIKGATERVEKDTRRSLITQTWTHKMRSFPHWTDHIELKKPPLQSVTSITYIDEDGNSQTWASSNYEVDTNREPGVVWLGYDKSFPSTRDIQNAVSVVYVAGYGATRSTIPETAKHAILLLVQMSAERRSPVGEEMDEYRSLTGGLRLGDYS